MKSIGIFLMLLFTTSLISCGIGHAPVINHNQNATEVHLSQNNFKVIEEVSASSETHYVLAIGGMNKRQLFENAYSAMIKKANLLNGSKAIINVMTEQHFSGFLPFYFRRTITVSA